MHKVKRGSADTALMRHRAEDQIRGIGAPERDSPLRAETAPELVYGLQVHQIELEMQNEELMRSRAEAQAGLKHYSELYDSAPVGYFTITPDSKILQVNLIGARLLGMERSQLVNRRFDLFVSESDRAIFNAFLTRAFESRAKESCEVSICDDMDRLTSFQHSEGKSRGSVRRTVLQIEGVVGEEQVCCAAAIDITERKMIESAHLFLLQSGWGGEDFFQSLSRYLAETLEMDYVCIDRLEGDSLSAQTLAIYHNGRFEDNAAYTLKDTPCGEVVGKTICSFNENVRRLFPKDAALQELMAESYVGTTLWSSHGKPIGLLALISSQPRQNLRIPELILSMASIRAAGELERRQGDEAMVKYKDELEAKVRERTHELQARAEQLRVLASELTQAEIEARNQLAAVLHDDLQQLLVCMKFAVASALMQTEKAKADHSLKKIENLLNQSIDKCRTLTAEISPPILAHGSLVDALRWLSHWMHEKYSLNVDLQIGENIDTARDVRALLFMAVRELLFNIVKHAGVNQAVVHMDRTLDGSLAITVTDKGKGFASNQRNEPGKIRSSFGLLSIQERLRYLGGQFEICSAPGCGTTMRLFAPIGRQPETGLHPMVLHEYSAR